MSIGRALRRLRFAVGLVLAALGLMWLISGAALGWIANDDATGSSMAQTRISPELVARSYANPGGAIAQTPGASGVTLTHFLDRVVWVVVAPDHPSLFDARTGEKLSPITEQMARAVAARDFVGESAPSVVAWQAAPSKEYRGPLPVWRAEFPDRLETRVYVSPYSGVIELRRNKYSSLHEFFRRLHTFDFQGRGEDGGASLRALLGLVFVLIVLEAGLTYAIWRREASSGIRPGLTN